MLVALAITHDDSSTISMRLDYGAPVKKPGQNWTAQLPVNVMSQGVFLKNFIPANLFKFRAALARQATGGAFVKVLFAGDSITAGAVSDAAATNYRTHSWVKVAADYLTKAGYTTSYNNAFGNAASVSGIGQPFSFWDSRLSGTGGYATLAAPFASTLGGYSFGTSTAGTISFAPGVSTDTCDIWYWDQLQVFGTSINGGANITTVTGGNTSQVKKVTISYAAGVQIINANWVSGSGNILGFDAYTAATPVIHMLNVGFGGSASTSWNNDAAQIVQLGAIEQVAPDLSFLMIGTNDWSSGSIPVSTYVSALNKFITGCKLSGDVIIVSPPPASTAVPIVTQLSYMSTLPGIASSNNVPFIDEYTNLVDKATMTANGLGADANHPNALGHQVIGRDVARAMLTVM